MDERDVQRELLIKNIQKLGGYATKISADRSAGLPDLMVKYPNTRAMFCEVKWKRFEVNPQSGKKIPIPLSPRQRVELGRMQKAGVVAFWLFVARTPTHWHLFTGFDMSVKSFQTGSDRPWVAMHITDNKLEKATAIETLFRRTERNWKG